MALGADSIANTAATPVTGFAGAAPVGVVSVGSVGKERQIQNVAAGQIGNLSTDAINGSQLYAVWQSANANAFHFVSINSNDASKGNYGNNGASGVNAVAIGVDTKATGLSSFAAGDNAFAQAKASVAIGQGAQALGNPSGGGSGFVDMGAVAIGYKAVSFDRGISIGNGAGSIASHGSIAIGQDGDGSVAGYGIGTGALGSGYDRVAIGTETGIRNVGDRNVSIGGEVGNDVNGNDNVALGGLRTGINVRGDRNIAIGNLAGSGINASDTLSLGTSAKASKANSIAFGNQAIASETNAIAIGTGSQALGDRDVIIGSNTKGPANGLSSSAVVGVGSNIQFVGAAVGRIEAVAVGEGVQVSDYGTGLGAQAVAGRNSTAVGTYALAKGPGSIAIGSANNTTGTKQTFADGADSIAIGNNSNTSSAATGSMALGVNASTTIANSVALGLGSIANVAAVPVAGFAGSAPVGVVSVGSVGKERQIQNVAAGQISNLSTDAINGSQLYSVWQSANAAANSSNIHFVSINSTDATKGNYGNDGAKGSAATAIGVDALAAGNNATALGSKSNASGLSSVALGESTAFGSSSTGIGYKANAYGSSGVAMGNSVIAKGNDSVAIGANGTVAGSRAVALGFRALADATNAVSIGTYSAAGTNSVGIGYSADATQEKTVAIGNSAYAGIESVQIGSSEVIAQSNHRGAFRRGTTLIGTEAVSQGLYSTITGNHSQLYVNQNNKVGGFGPFGGQFTAQGAFTNLYGAYNTVGNNTSSKDFNSVAVTVVGSANQVQESNGAFVAGYGNNVTNSYKGDINVSLMTDASSASIAKILNDPKTELGQIGVIGAGNKLDTANNTVIMGMRNNVNVANKSSVAGFNQTANAINFTSISGADSTVNNTNYVYTTGINNTINNAENVIALGNNMVVGSATTTAKNSILLGNHIAFASKDNMANAVSIGDYSRANTGAVAVGVSAQALGEDSIAIGRDAIATGSIATGSSARAGNGGAAYGDDAVATYLNGAITAGTVAGAAFGQNSQADVSAAVALGTNAVVTQINSVALGADSVANIAATPVAGFAGAAPVGVVSVGSAGNERQIQNVAAGQINDKSTDAINGSQLYASNTLIQQNSTNITELQKGWTLASNNSAKSEQITAGETVNFNPGSNIAITQTGNAISIATTPTVAFDQVTVGGVVINKTTGIKAGDMVVSNVASGSALTDAVNVSQLNKAMANASSSWDLVVNKDPARSIGKGSVIEFKDGKNIAINQTGNAISIATTPNVAFDQVTVGGVVINNTTGINAGGLKITKVANGDVSSLSKDAVNGSQLFALWQAANAVSNATSIHYVSINDNGVQGGNYANDGATGINAVAIGVNANASQDNAISIGANSLANIKDSVALGSQSQTTAAAPTANTVIAGSTVKFAGISPVGVVSVGSVGSERQIQNVAAGQITDMSTDAINGSQLFRTNEVVTQQGNILQQHSIDITNLKNQTGTQYAGLKVENGSDTILANESLNIVGQDGTTVTYDKNSNTYTVASKQGGGSGTGSMNDWNVTGKDGSGSSVNVPITDGKNVAFAAGSKNVIVTPSQTADGAQVQVDIAKDLELSSVTTKNTNGNSTVLNGDGVIAKNANGSSTVVNGNGVTIKGKDGKNGASITQAGIDAGNQTLKNVADGQEDTDAVNVRQLREVSQSMGNVHKRIDEVEDNANAGTAAAMAMANLPQPANAGEGGMSLGLGTYQGESGYAVGYSAISENGNWIFKASATGNSQGKIGAGAGVFFKMH